MRLLKELEHLSEWNANIVVNLLSHRYGGLPQTWVCTIGLLPATRRLLAVLVLGRVYARYLCHVICDVYICLCLEVHEGVSVYSDQEQSHQNFAAEGNAP
jgi:hypothetical protein